MRILVLLTDAFGGYGGIAKYNRDLLNAFCSHPAVSEVVALPRSAPNPFEPMPSKLAYRAAALGGMRAYAQALSAELLQRTTFERVFCAHINLLPLAIPAALRFRAPLSLMIYGIEAWEPPAHWARKYGVRAVASVASISDVTVERFASWSRVPRERCHLLPNAFDAAAFGIGPKPLALEERYGLANRKVLMTFGRLVGRDRAKGFDEVLEALPHVAATVPNVSYLIAGDGPDRSRLQDKARALNVEHRVVFTGMVAEHEKADHYRLADLFVMPSRGEGFGFVFLEALACGVPCIGSVADGSREALRDGKLGALVEPGDAASLIREILKGLNQEHRIPSGLRYFEYENFERRVHAFVNDTAAS